jgi:hypothetical protein
VQESVDVADGVVDDSVTLVGVRLQVSPVEGDGLAVRLTVPENPFGLETVMVDVPGVPEKTNSPGGLAPTVKSCTV